MTLSPRQWMIVFGLIVVFGVAALVVRSGDSDTPAFDTAAWCAGASVLEGWSPLLDGSAETAAAADFERFKQAMYDVEGLAPFELRTSISQLVNFTIVSTQSLADTAWPDAFDVARARVDAAAVDAAFADVTGELQACGIRF